MSCAKENLLPWPPRPKSQHSPPQSQFPFTCHWSSTETLNKILQSWYWPGIEKEVKLHCQDCRICLATNPAPNQKPIPMGKLENVPDFTFQVHIDSRSKWTESQGYMYLLVIQDGFSKWMKLVPLTDKMAESATKGILNKWVHCFGPMKVLVSDQGKEFVNFIIAKSANNWELPIKPPVLSTPGLVKWTNQTLLTYLHKYLGQGNDWTTLVPFICFSFNTARHSSTGCSPFFVLCI